MFTKILVPVDFTSKNNTAIEAALELAGVNHGQIILFHVIEKIQLLSSKETHGFYRKLKENADTKIRKMARRRAGVKTEIVFGNRAKGNYPIFSLNQKTDLIVMASHKINPTSPNQGWGTISYKVANTFTMSGSSCEVVNAKKTRGAVVTSSIQILHDILSVTWTRCHRFVLR